MSGESSKLTADGRSEAARANELRLRQTAAAAKVTARLTPRIAAAPWPRKLELWLRMQAELRREQARIEEEVAPQEGLYLRSG